MDFAQRKHPRFKGYDYSQNGCYFITFCVKNREPLLGTPPAAQDAQISPEHSHLPPRVTLTAIGKLTDTYIQNIQHVYDGVSVDHYCIMPDHVHLLLTIAAAENGGTNAPSPTVNTIVRSLKKMITRQIGTSIWQDSFYDRVVRNEEEYLEIWQYIEENPYKLSQTIAAETN